MKPAYNKIAKWGAGALIGCAAMLTSCSDALNITPDGRLTMEEVFSNVDYTEAYFSSAFDDIPRKHINYFWFDNLPSALSDESWSCDDVEGVGAVNAYKGQGSADNNIFEYYYMDGFDCNYWEKYWRCVRNINVFLEAIPTAAVRSEADREHMIAEAKILRAYYYLQLVKWYGDIPWITEAPSLDSDFSDYRRQPAYEILQHCVADCEEALQSPHLAWRLYNVDERNRLTKGVACAIISQASLFAASKLYCKDQNLWEYAYQKNKLAFDQLTSNGFALYFGDNCLSRTEGYNSAYAELFAGPPEYPVECERIMTDIKNNQPSYWVWGMPIQSNYRAGDVPTQELVDSYDMLATGLPVLNREQPYLDEYHLKPNYYDNDLSGYNPNQPFKGRDLRFEATVIHNGSIVYVGDQRSTVQTYEGGNCAISDNSRTYTRTGYYNNKYRQWYSCASKRVDDGHWVYFRLGEVYLNLAEACVETNRLPEAFQYINEIRHRAGFDPSVDLSSADQHEARLILRKERRVEFVFEEHRFFDCRRWTANDEDIIEEKYATGMRVVKNGLKYNYERFLIGTDGSQPSKLSYEAKWHFLPIPLKESSTLAESTGLFNGYWQNYGW